MTLAVRRQKCSCKLLVLIIIRTVRAYGLKYCTTSAKRPTNDVDDDGDGFCIVPRGSPLLMARFLIPYPTRLMKISIVGSVTSHPLLCVLPSALSQSLFVMLQPI